MLLNSDFWSPIRVLGKEGRHEKKKKRPDNYFSKYSSFLSPMLLHHTFSFPHTSSQLSFCLWQVVLEPPQVTTGSAQQFSSAALCFLVLILCSSISPPQAADTQVRPCSDVCGSQAAIPLGCPCPSVGDAQLWSLQECPTLALNTSCKRHISSHLYSSISSTVSFQDHLLHIFKGIFLPLFLKYDWTWTPLAPLIGCSVGIYEKIKISFDLHTHAFIPPVHISKIIFHSFVYGSCNT